MQRSPHRIFPYVGTVSAGQLFGRLGMMWNWMAGILTTAMAVVVTTLTYVLWIESKRRTVFWGSPELWVFGVTGAVVVVTLWGILAVQWWRI